MYKHKKFKIGKIEIKNPIFLAPMAAVTDRPLRIICKEFGPVDMYNEFDSADVIIREILRVVSVKKSNFGGGDFFIYYSF